LDLIKIFVVRKLFCLAYHAAMAHGDAKEYRRATDRRTDRQTDTMPEHTGPTVLT